MTAEHIRHLDEQGYAIVRGLLPPDVGAALRAAVDAVHAEGLTHHATYRDGNLCFEVLNDPEAMRRVVIQAYWFS